MDFRSDIEDACRRRRKVAETESRQLSFFSWRRQTHIVSSIIDLSLVEGRLYLDVAKAPDRTLTL